MQLALSVYVVVELAVPDRRRSAVAARARRHAVGRERGVDAVLALVCAYAALLVPLVVLIGQLALFHAMLVRRGLTTYEYILGEQRVDERELRGLYRGVQRGRHDGDAVSVLDLLAHGLLI